MHTRNIRKRSDSRGKCIGDAQTKVVVAVVGVVVVAIGDPAVLGVVVPTPAAFDTVGGANGLYPNNARLKDSVSYWHRWAMMLVALCKNACCSIETCWKACSFSLRRARLLFRFLLLMRIN